MTLTVSQVTGPAVPPLLDLTSPRAFYLYAWPGLTLGE